MRHHNQNRTFGRKKGQRNALLRGLAESLIMRGSIETTEAKAKELRPFVEKLVTQGKKDTVAARRLAQARLKGSARTVSKLFGDIAPKYKDRNGGYTRIIRTRKGVSDARQYAVIEFI